MGITRTAFLNILERSRIRKSVIQKIKKTPASPLNVVYEKLQGRLPQENNIEHSYRIFQYATQMLSNLKLKFTHDDFLVLFYSSLLHDVSKATSGDLLDEIKKFKMGKCQLMFDHGITSAHYIKKKVIAKKIRLYGLEKDNTRKMLNIISFHKAGTMHSCFRPKDKLTRKELLLCLAFRLADIADGGYERALDTEFVEESDRSPKGKARSKVKKVLVGKDIIIWRTKKKDPELHKSLCMSNDELSRHRLLLQAFGLPFQIVCLSGKERVKKDKDIVIDYDDIMSANLCLDVSGRKGPLVLSSKTLKELYEKIVDAFCQIGVTGKDSESSGNLFGPILLEVTNIEDDEAEKINVRSETGKNIDLIKKYSEKWLGKKEGSENFLFYGYTHGQRIWRYLYPKRQREVHADFKKWTGKLDQFNKNIVKILKKQGSAARRSYAVIAHPIIDNPEIGFSPKDDVGPMGPPALTVIQFRLEKDNRLSGFAFLRAQELSIFFIVNYFEIKNLIEKLRKRLQSTFPNIKPGRIVMMSTLGYFAPNTTLLDKPRISQKDEGDITYYVENLNKAPTREEFINLLREFAEGDYHRIETKWCDYARSAITGLGHGKIRNEIFRLKKALKDLDDMQSNKKYPVTHPKIKQGKKKAINRFIKVIRRTFQ